MTKQAAQPVSTQSTCAACAPSSTPTESLCPVCLQKVSAALVTEGDTVSLQGRCPEHGEWRSVVWVGPPSLESWSGAGAAGDGACDCSDTACRGPAPRYEACPGECGLCSDHGQKTCTAVLEVTRRCNLSCPICFADSSSGPDGSDPSIAEVEESLLGLFEAQGAVNLQLSGGEPTVRDDLPEIIRTAGKVGFSLVQVNTNGLRLATEPGYAENLRDSGLESVFLQFDGLNDPAYRTLRGRPLLDRKLRAVERCGEAGLGVVLVPTVVAGVNDRELGDLVRFAAAHAGVVRGLHLQPVSYFGRFPAGAQPRLTLPEALRALEAQTGGELQAADFRPSTCEHTRCSFRARYWVRAGGRLELVAAPAPSCCSSEPEVPGEAARRAIAATSRQWRARTHAAAAASAGSDCCGDLSAAAQAEPPDALTRFLDEAGKILCISGMLFQDAWSIDLERVRRCCVHSVVPGRGLVPFCLWNLTGREGQRLYPRC